MRRPGGAPTAVPRSAQNRRMAQTIETRPATRAAGAPPPEHHRNVNGGSARAAVFGVSDGLLTNVALILGVAGASPAAGVVRLAGLAGLVGGAFSMAAGEYVSVSAQRELVQREIDVERHEITNHPETERRELVNLYVRRGVRREVAEEVAGTLMSDPETALEVHTREELGVTPGAVGAPLRVAASSFGSFCVGAVVPLLPWFFMSGHGAIAVSLGLAAALAFAIGLLVASLTGRSRLRTAVRQLGIAVAASLVTFAIGSLVGVRGGS